MATLALTILLYVLIPKGFFPLQDTGFIQAITDGRADVSFDEWRSASKQLADKILQDPDVTEPVQLHRRGRHQQHPQQRPLPDHLKPTRTSADSITDVMNQLQRPAPTCQASPSILQPVQDLTIDSVVSRAPVPVRAARRDHRRPQHFVPKLMAQLAKTAAVKDVSTDFLDKGLSAYVDVDRDTAARFGITLATIDNALYDSFGQRIVTTIFTQSNQYRVIMEADPLQNSVSSMDDIYLPSRRRPGAVVRDRHSQATADPAADRSYRPVPGRHHLLRHGTRAIRWAKRWTRSSRPNSVVAAASITTHFQGSALAFQTALGNE